MHVLGVLLACIPLFLVLLAMLLVFRVQLVLTLPAPLPVCVPHVLLVGIPPL